MEVAGGNYLATRHPMMAYVLRWAENRGKNRVIRDEVESFRRWMIEDPHVVDHFLWGFRDLNLTGAAREIFSNTGRSNGLEVRRKIHALIFVKNEQRQEEFPEKIHRPRAVANAGAGAGALEAWDTDQRMHREVGGLEERNSATCF